MFYRTLSFGLILFFSVLPARAADAARGEILFSSNCEMCHPGGGNSLTPDKPLRGSAFASKYPRDEMIINTVRKGIPQTVMSPFSKERLSDEQLKDIVAFIRTMTPTAKQSGPKKTADTCQKKPSVPGSPSKPQPNNVPRKKAAAASLTRR